MASVAKRALYYNPIGRAGQAIALFALSLALPWKAEASPASEVMHYVDAELRPFPEPRDSRPVAPNFLKARFLARIADYRERWTRLPQAKLRLTRFPRRGTSGPDVSLLRERLGLSPDGSFDGELANAIEAFRADHGLSPGMHVDEALVAALNRSPANYLARLEQNAARLAMLPQDLPERFVLVDTASQQLLMFEGEKVVDTMRVVVGASDRQTPMMAAYLRFAEVDPYWHIPEDLVREDFAPRVQRRGLGYLRRAGYEAVRLDGDSLVAIDPAKIDWAAVRRGDRALKMRQKPGPGNAMGRVKFMFPNALGIYLHDTPQRGLLSRNVRLFSAGCVRLEDAGRLGEWLFGRDILAVRSMPARRIDLKERVPVFITYFTAWPEDTGWSWRDDVYGRDTAPQVARSPAP